MGTRETCATCLRSVTISLMSLRLFHPAKVHLFFQNEAPLYYENFFNDGDDCDLALLAYGGHGLNLSIDGDTLDLYLFMLQQLIDQLFIAMSYPRDTDARCLHTRALSTESCSSKTGMTVWCSASRSPWCSA